MTMVNLALTKIATQFRMSLTGLNALPSKILPLPKLPPVPQPVVLTVLGDNSVIPGSGRTRPLWFDGRFLAAQDLQRDQVYFVQDQEILGQAAGFGVVHGLTVTRVMSGGEPDAQTIVIAAGQGITPGGELVVLSADLTVRIFDIADEENLDEQFGLSETPDPIARTRSGLYVIALRPVEFTAQPITAYPSDIQGSTQTQDGNVIEATAVALVPYPIPASNYDSTSQMAAAARQVFLDNNLGALSDSLLPVAMVSLERGAIQWLDQWMVRRESGPESDPLRFGLTSVATEQAYIQQFDAQLQQIVDPMVASSRPPKFPATDYFQALPPAGRIPLGSIDVMKLTQIFFPPQTKVTLSLVPEDELVALIEDSMSLPPIDLTQPADAYADLSVLVLVPVARKDYATFAGTLTPVPLASPLPLAIAIRGPIQLLRLFVAGPASGSSGGGGTTWQTAIGSQAYGYFVRQRSAPAYISFSLTDTTTTLTTAPVAGSQATQYTATILPSAATGTVTFNDGDAAIGVADINGGTATLVLPNLAAGVHSLTAVYHGDVNYNGSTSDVVALTI